MPRLKIEAVTPEPSAVFVSTYQCFSFLVISWGRLTRLFPGERWLMLPVLALPKSLALFALVFAARWLESEAFPRVSQSH